MKNYTPYFNKAILFTLDNEDSNWRTQPKLENLGDGAGLTFMGLTQEDDEKLLPGGMTIQELAAIYLDGNEEFHEYALDMITDIYYHEYWLVNKINAGYDNIESYKIACRLFDFGVNRGPIPAVTALQKACNALMPSGVEIAEDGLFGSKTLNRVNSLIRTYGENKLYNAFVYQCRKQYSGLLESRNEQVRQTAQNSYQGWINRLEREIN